MATLPATRRRIVTVLGTRPEIIKCSPLLPELDTRYDHCLVHTGQHYDAAMDSRFFEELGLRPADHNLGVGSGSHATQLARMLEGVAAVVEDFAPDAVVVQGDTNSTLAGGLAAAKLGRPVIHLEAGCRSHNRAMPEEINRIVVDHLSALCLAPDEPAADHLRREGIGADRVAVVGSTGVDACLRMASLHRNGDVVARFGVAKGGYLLATVHRAENTTPERLAAITGALSDLSRDWPVIFPVHPRTARVLAEIGAPAGVDCLDPLGYPEMIALLRDCRALLTDSGGLQEEAAVLGAPAFILRHETEWTAFVDAGRHVLVGTDRREITRTVRAMLTGDAREERLRTTIGLERAGAAERALVAIQRWFDEKG